MKNQVENKAFYPFSPATDDYLAGWAGTTTKPATRKDYRGGLKKFLEYCEQNNIKHCDKTALDSFAESYKDRTRCKDIWIPAVKSYSRYVHQMQFANDVNASDELRMFPASLNDVDSEGSGVLSTMAVAITGVESFSDNKQTNPKDPDWLEFMDRYFKVRIISDRSELVYRAEISRFFRYAGTFNPTDTDLENYNAHNVQTCSLATAHHRLTILKRFFNFLRTKGLYSAIDPTDMSVGQKVEKQWTKHVIQINDQRKILKLASTNRRDYALFLLLFSCALRGSEIVNINIEDLKKESGQSVLYILGKGRTSKSDFITLPNIVAEAIQTYIGDRPLVAGDPVFLSCSNKSKCKRISLRGLESIVDSYFTKIGIKSREITLHSCRHTSITNALNSGADVQKVQRLARHKDINTTMIYAHNLNDYDNDASTLAISKIVEN